VFLVKVTLFSVTKYENKMFLGKKSLKNLLGNFMLSKKCTAEGILEFVADH
jgi:hypothetical protein